MLVTPDGETTIDAPNVAPIAIEIIASYVARNRVQAADLPGLIEAIHATVSVMMGQAPAPETKLRPAVPISKSVQHDYIVCLEDGRKLKTLRKYLRTQFNLTPEAYREKWGLPDDYPMTAPEYSVRRSKYAHDMGLGRGNKRLQPKPAPKR